MKKRYFILPGVFLAAVLTACSNGENSRAASSAASISSQESETSSEETEEANGEVTLLYTNDIHGYINNKNTDENGNETDGLSYANVKALKDSLTEEGKNVLLADVGDHLAGAVYSGISEGEDMIQLMNKTGYDIATIGNHEFDYGREKAFELMESADFPYVCCNFYDADSSLVFPAYEVLESGGIKIAFIGITTPETITKSSPSYFQNAKGEQLYTIAAGDDGQELYDTVQEAIDEAKQEADVVIALGHLGSIEYSAPYRSTDVIEHTSGLDAFLDGHSHTVMEENYVKDKDGNEVLLTQTGCYFSAIGEADIKVTDGQVEISTSLISSYDKKDEEVQEAVDEVVQKTEDALGETIAQDSTAFYINEPGTETRMVRKQETNLSDLVCDSLYYYFNDYLKMDCDIALQNAGGIRADMTDGIHTYMDCKTVLPFGNVICMVKLSGQQIKDALEWGARNLPAETTLLFGSGITYKIDTSIESSVQEDSSGAWAGAPTGEYRVYDIQVYNKEKAQYEPIDLDKTYNVAGANYILRNEGDGLSMFKDAELVIDYVAEDYMVLADYVKVFANSSVSSENSPLSGYTGLLIDYENPYGAGRIEIK